ncbi:uncharacterized protein LOC126814263 [Patella vulgata]|uniref:uncharacterized protein LOC126814263 n=1 Tax=Patella vulgata TaxID=6465 RepID=UPI0024A9FD5C|nr:uncharacterized protein LOC126814263 [Patella vulgata]
MLAIPSHISWQNKRNMEECEKQRQDPGIIKSDSSVDNSSHITAKDSSCKCDGIATCTDAHLLCHNTGVCDGDQAKLAVTTIGKSDLPQTIADPKHEDGETAEKLDESPQSTVSKPGDAFVPNPWAEEFEKLKQENEELKQKNEENEELKQKNEELKQKNEMLIQEKGRTNDVKQGSRPVIIPLKERGGMMAEKDRVKFIVHMPFLIEELHPENLITMMFSKFLINDDDVEKLRKILENQGRKRCAEKMLFMLLRCGRYAYTIFLKCLELTDYRNVIKKLEPNCEVFGGIIKLPDHHCHELITKDHPKHKEFMKKVEGDLEDIYDSTELLVITELTKGCVQVTFRLISLGSKSESELREVLESKVKSGYIGDNKVSTEGFSFNKIDGVRI